MADRLFFPHPGRIGHNRVDIEFSFRCNGASNPTTASYASAGNVVASITYAATGKYTITFSGRDYYNAVVWADANLEDAATPDGSYATAGNVTNEGTSSPLTFMVSTFNAAGVPAQFSGRRVWVKLTLRNTAAAASQGVP